MCYHASDLVPLTQTSLEEIVKHVAFKQDAANMASVSTARLAQLQFNMKRGRNTPALEDISDFLPYPGRFRELTQIREVSSVSQQAARDYLRYRKKLPIWAFLMLKDWHDGLVAKARE